MNNTANNNNTNANNFSFSIEEINFLREKESAALDIVRYLEETIASYEEVIDSLKLRLETARSKACEASIKYSDAIASIRTNIKEALETASPETLIKVLETATTKSPAQATAPAPELAPAPAATAESPAPAQATPEPAPTAPELAPAPAATPAEESTEAPIPAAPELAQATPAAEDNKKSGYHLTIDVTSELELW